MGNRYTDIFLMKTSSEMTPAMGIIKDRSSDLYITYNSADRLDLISNRVYGDPKYWWIILSANDYKIEFDIESGEILRIPLPLADVLNDIRTNINGKL